MGIPQAYSFAFLLGAIELNFFEYRRALWRQEHVIAKLEQDDPNPNNDPELAVTSSYYTELDHAWRRLGQIHSQYYEGRAKQAAIPLPSREEPGMYDRIEWEYDIPLAPIYYLSEHGIKQVRAQLWDADKQSREKITYWFGIFAGVIGSLTGLISAWKG